jgi:hypothetical protein
LSDPIVHTPYDLGLGVTLGWEREVQVGDTCHVQLHHPDLILIWEVWGAPKPLLVVTFCAVQTVRVLDEMWLSTESEPHLWEGIDGSFARTVEGGEFPTPIGLMKTIAGSVVHYQFVTDCDCVDVIARDQPTAKFIERPQIAEHQLDLESRL